MKRILKKLFFSSTKPNRILSGVSSGMLTNYDPKDRTLHLLGLYEREIYPFLEKAMKRSETLVDIGANDGYYAVAFAKQGGKKVIVCEPSPIEKAKLIQNMNLNGFKEMKDFVLIDKFVSDKSNDKEISINELIGDRKSALILIDVDGGEKKIIEGFNFNSGVSIDWLIETHTIELEEAIVALLISKGYVVSIIRSAWWRLIFPEQRPLPHNRWLFATKNP
jgi:hypothetical protein